MKVIFVSCLCSEKTFNKMNKEFSGNLSQAVQKYHRLIVEGLAMQDNVSIETISSRPIASTSKGNIYYKSFSEKVGSIVFNYLPIINVPILKHINLFITTFLKVMNYYKKDKDLVIICDVLNISVCAGAVFATKIKRIKSVGIVTDLPKFQYNSRINRILSNFILKLFKSYVFITDEMKNEISVLNKKYCVIEGLVDVNMKEIENDIYQKVNPRICMYAGSLRKIYGIKMLVEGFIAAQIPNAELHIYGKGDFEDELMMLSKKNINIKYFGTLENSQIVTKEIESTLLINPRPTNEEYTKYSFPSKNMEYMVSGTPVLTTKLPGMPKEYYNHVYLIDSETKEGISNELRKIFMMEKDNIHKKGYLAKEFVLNEKNNYIQSKKILNMVRSLNITKRGSYERN